MRLLKKKIESPEGKEKMQDRILSLFRFNITFKLTLEFSITFLSFIILVNMLFYLGIKTWMYMETVDVMKIASESLLSNVENQSEINDELFGFEKLEYFIYRDSDKNLLGTNSQKKIAYSEHNTRIPLYGFIQRHNPQWFYYEKLSDDENASFNIVIRKDATNIHKEIDFLWSVVFFVSIFLLLLVWLSLFRISTKHLKPIKIMTQKVEDISVRNLSTRLDIRGTKDELKDLAATFNNMMDEIEKAYENQKQFVSDASHELRTPIAVIKGYASMVNRWGKEDPGVLEESLKAIEDESRNMQSLVESLLFLARRDKGNMEMEKEIFNVKEFMTEIVKETQLIDSGHTIKGEFDYDGEIFASIDKLKQAIRIFIDNSMKYTHPEGEINIRLKASDKEVYLVIQDNGIGISKEDLPHIFERFYRADQARTRNKKGGTGLGLAIAKVIIEQHGGEINVESEIGNGTTVTILLPKNLKSPG